MVKRNLFCQTDTTTITKEKIPLTIKLESKQATKAKPTSI